MGTMNVAAGTIVGRFFCPGRARTKGSLKCMGGKSHPLQEQGVYSVPWKKAMIDKIRKVYGFAPPKIVRVVGRAPQFVFTHNPHSGPVAVTALFHFDRTVGVNGECWESHNSPYPTSIDIGDLDKLLRNLLDALTQSGMIKDDSQVTRISAEKRWCLPCETAGVEVQVSAL